MTLIVETNVTCEQLGKILLRWTIEASKNPLKELDVGKMSEHKKRKLEKEIIILEMFAITYAVQQKITNPDMRQAILDSYDEHIGAGMKHTGMEVREAEFFEKTLHQRYRAYYDALRKDSEARRTGDVAWHVGKTAAEHALGHSYSKDPLWITALYIKFVTTFRATKHLLGQYKVK